MSPQHSEHHRSRPLTFLEVKPAGGPAGLRTTASGLLGRFGQGARNRAIPRRTARPWLGLESHSRSGQAPSCKGSGALSSTPVVRWKPLSPGSGTQLGRVPLTCTWGPGHQAQCPVPLPLGKRQPVCRPWAGGERRRGSLGGVSRDPSGRGKPLAEGRPARDPAPGGAVGEAVLSNHSISVLPTACGPARPGGVSGAPF